MNDGIGERLFSCQAPALNGGGGGSGSAWALSSFLVHRAPGRVGARTGYRGMRSAWIALPLSRSPNDYVRYMAGESAGNGGKATSEELSAVVEKTADYSKYLQRLYTWSPDASPLRAIPTRYPSVSCGR